MISAGKESDAVAFSGVFCLSFNQETMLFGFIFKVLGRRLSFCGFGTTGWTCRCVPVNGNLHHCGGFTSYPLPFGRRRWRNREAETAVAQAALQAGSPLLSLYSACCQLAGHRSVSCRREQG